MECIDFCSLNITPPQVSCLQSHCVTSGSKKPTSELQEFPHSRREEGREGRGEMEERGKEERGREREGEEGGMRGRGLPSDQGPHHLFPFPQKNSV